jgi:dATP pyrophosphohydrolase
MSDQAGYKRPESVLIVVHTPQLRCLLLERVEPAGFWQSVTGSLRWGESAAEAAARELREETGLEPTGLVDARIERTFTIMPAWRHRFEPGVTENREHWWYLVVPEPCEIKPNRAEHTQYRWRDLDAAIALVSSWTNREALERLRPV